MDAKVPEIKGVELKVLKKLKLKAKQDGVKDTRCRKDRRDIDEQVESVSEGKLDYLTPDQRSGTRSSKGLSPDQYIKEALKTKLPKNGRLGAKFWVGFFTAFPMLKPKKSFVDELVLDPGYVCNHIELKAALRSARSRNTATRDSDRLEMFFLNTDTLESLSRSDVLGAVKAVQVDGVVIVESVSKKLMSAIFHYCGRIL